MSIVKLTESDRHIVMEADGEDVSIGVDADDLEVAQHEGPSSSGGQPGPCSFDQIMAWPEQIEEDARQHASSVYHCLRRNMNEPLVLTSHYSGIGCAEVAVAMLRKQFHEHGPPVQFYSATENDPTARKMLLQQAHVAPVQGPSHIFGDICSRIPVDVLAQLKQIEFDALEAAHQLNRLGPEDKKQQQDTLGFQMLSAMCAKLETCNFVEYDYCYKHGRRCPLRAVREPGVHHGDISGTVCVAWSSMRRNNSHGRGWLHSSTLPCVTWIFWLKHVQPHWFLHECVPNFDYHNLADQLKQYCVCSLKTSPSVLGLPANRWRRFAFGFHGQTCLLSNTIYEVLSGEDKTPCLQSLWEQLVEAVQPEPGENAPADRGSDSSSTSSASSSNGKAVLPGNASPGPDENLDSFGGHEDDSLDSDPLAAGKAAGGAVDCETDMVQRGVQALQSYVSDLYNEIFKRQISVGCEVYLEAPHTLVQQFEDRARYARGVDCNALAADVSSCLTGAQFQRLVGYREMIRQTCQNNPAKVQMLQQFPFCAINLQQTSGFHSSISHVMPALLTKSTLLIVKAVTPAVTCDPDPLRRVALQPADGRQLLAIEHFGVMSFPLALHDSSHEQRARWRPFFPWQVAWLLQEFNEQDLRRFTGNAMNLHSLGSVLALLLALYTLHAEAKTSEPQSEHESEDLAPSSQGHAPLGTQPAAREKRRRLK